MKYNDYPLEECLRTAQPLLQEGATIHQKFTCSACGSRQTCAEANRFFTHGRCEECSHITNLQAQGCNYLVIWGVDLKPEGTA